MHNNDNTTNFQLLVVLGTFHFWGYLLWRDLHLLQIDSMFIKRTATFCSSSTRRGLHLVALNNGRRYKSRQSPHITRIPSQHFDDVICNNNVQMIYNSSSFSSMPSYDTSTPSSSSSKSFKKVIRPFLLACHPDVSSSQVDNDNSSKSSRRKQHPLSQQAKDTNLKAVQTLNGLIDVLDDFISRCTPPSYQQSRHDTKKSAASLPELNSRYEIEFILPPTTTTNTADDNDRPIKRKHRDKLALTLRSITISFPEALRSNVRQYALNTFHEEEAYQTAQQLKDHAMSELLRLLTIAGMSVPVDVVNEQQGRDHRRGDQRKQKGQWTLSDHFLNELGIDPTDDVQETPSQAFFGRTQSRPTSPHVRQSTVAPPTYSHPQLQQQREAFMQSFQKVSHKFENDYDQAFLDAQADHTTSRLNLYNENTVEGRERREQLVSTICGGVRIWRAKIYDNKDSDQDLNDEVPEGLDVVAQLIAIRRLSLILYDNFDYLKMEKMGRMYEQLTIVLTPPRNNLTNRRKPKQKMLREDGTRVHPGRKLNKWERNRKKRDRLQNLGSRGRMRYIAEKYLGKKNDDDYTEEEGDEDERKTSYQFESGFRFSYGTQTDQGIGKVTAYIPVDFRDGELVRQMYTHLYDYFDNCCGKVGWLSYGADGNIKANMEDDNRYEA